MMIKAKNLSLVALLAIVVVCAASFWVASYLHRPLVMTQDEIIDVPAGGSLNGLINNMAQRGMFGDTDNDIFLHRLSVRGYNIFTNISHRLHVGEYKLHPGDTLVDVLQKLERGEVLQRSFALIEGWNTRELRRALQRTEGLVIRLAGVSDEQMMVELGKPGRHPEGWFAPDTYFYTSGESDVDILKRAMLRQESILDTLWRNRDTGLPYSDPYDALIMASIVEKETGAAHERQQIAGVFVQRLLRGMRLQTDPTVIYGMGESYQGNIRRKDLKEPTPYNTYVIRGMPPTPIAMPGEQAIYAAMHPAQTQFLYFVARGDGTHKFSATLQEHQQAVQEYQLKRKQNYRSAPAVETP